MCDNIYTLILQIFLEVIWKCSLWELPVKQMVESGAWAFQKIKVLNYGVSQVCLKLFIRLHSFLRPGGHFQLMWMCAHSHGWSQLVMCTVISGDHMRHCIDIDGHKQHPITNTDFRWFLLQCPYARIHSVILCTLPSYSWTQGHSVERTLLLCGRSLPESTVIGKSSKK